MVRPGIACGLLLLSMCEVAFCAPARPERRVVVDSAETAAEAIGDALPGDVIALKDGAYEDFRLAVRGNGTIEEPIKFCAQNPGKVRFTGDVHIDIAGEHLTVDGFLFDQACGPNGENVLSENARGTFNAAKYDFAQRLYKFVAHGHVIIPRDGSYRLQVSRAAGIQLNGMSYTVGSPVAGKPPYADVELTRGVYKVSFDVGNNGGQLGYAMVRIVENEAKTELPIFIYESELKTFRNDLSLGVEMRETSRWTREDNEIK